MVRNDTKFQSILNNQCWVPVNSRHYRCGILEQVVLKIPKRKDAIISSLKKHAKVVMEVKELRFSRGTRASTKLCLREGYPSISWARHAEMPIDRDQYSRSSSSIMRRFKRWDRTSPSVPGDLRIRQYRRPGCSRFAQSWTADLDQAGADAFARLSLN
jgi:hypothetical protein